jgi:hypothetical protein
MPLEVAGLAGYVVVSVVMMGSPMLRVVMVFSLGPNTSKSFGAETNRQPAGISSR